MPAQAGCESFATSHVTMRRGVKRMLCESIQFMLRLGDQGAGIGML